MNTMIRYAFFATAFSLFSSLAHSQTDINKIFSVKGFEIGETCTSAKDKLHAAVNANENDLFEARIDMQMVALSCPENSLSTFQGESISWFAAFGPKTNSGESSFKLTFNSQRKLIGITLRQNWTDSEAPLLDLVYKQVVAKFGKPYFALAFERPTSTAGAGPFNDAYWSANNLNPLKTAVQQAYSSDCFTRPAKVKRADCGIDAIDRRGDERDRALASARGVSAKAIFTPSEKNEMRIRFMQLEIVDVAQMAVIAPRNVEKPQSTRDLIERLESMKLPKL